MSILRCDLKPAPRLTEQTVHVTTVERENGVRTAEHNAIRSALHDLADRNSMTHTVRLPHGTVIKLAHSVSPSIGSWRARYEITNGEDTPKTAIGVSKAADLAKEVDVLAMSKKDKDKIRQVAEEEHPLREIEIHVSGYVTKKGKHVGAYSQIRKKIEALGPGQSLHLPDGIAVRKTPNGYSVGSTKAPQLGGVSKSSAKDAADDVARKSAGSTDPKSIGGRTAHSIDKGTDINALPNSGDNPKLPGTPHPDDVAHRAAKARKEAVKRLPSRKERAENERKAGERRKVENRQVEAGNERDAIERTAASKADASEDFASLDSRLQRLKDARASTQTSLDELKKRPGADKGRVRGYEAQIGEYDKKIRDLRMVRDRKGRRERDESPMPGIIRKPSEVDARRRNSSAPLRTPGGFKIPPKPGETEDEQRRRSDREEARRGSGSKGAKPNTDGLATYRQGDGTPGSGRQVKDDVASNIDREKRKRAKAVAKHPAAKARRKFKGLSESASTGLIGR